jgi:two-component system sensor histidine kinase PilS (NtrC family)
MQDSGRPVSSGTLQRSDPTSPVVQPSSIESPQPTPPRAIAAEHPTLEAMLDPRRLLRWLYIGRMSVATAIFAAAVFVWTRADTDTHKLLVASLAFVLATGVTVLSAWYSEIYRKALQPTFFYLQSTFDLLLVTAVVHVTNGSTSQFAALYILIIATASLLLPVGGGLLIAALGNVLYVADTVLISGTSLVPAVWLQLGVFATVALGSAYLGAQLQRAGAGKERLVAQLQAARLQADEILRNIRSGVITVDSGGRLLYVNPTAEQLLGEGLRKHIGEPVLAQIGEVAPELSQALERSVKHQIRTTRAEGLISTVVRRFPIGVTTTYTDGEAGDLDRTATAIFQDISDQKRIDALRLRAERLEGIAELSASLAHEIKNPLASIRSAVEQLARMPRAGDDERTLTGLVVRESDRLSRLLSEFLDFARVRVARTRPIDMGEVARHAARLAEARPERKDVRIVCELPERVSLMVDGDDDLLHRAVFNLVLNAVQASPNGGVVHIDVTPGSFDPLPLGVTFDAGTVALRVRDAGAGIPIEIRDRLFDPFFTTKPGGSGLGLAVVQRAIEAHRGLVFVDSSGHGTRFTIVLPRTQPVRTGAKETPPASVPIIRTAYATGSAS